MAITAADVNQLRKMTGAGMMDCKNALVEADGNFDKAIDIIRTKGQLVASKRADREASEGCVLAGTNDNFAAIVALRCETDFVAKNANFVAFTQSILTAALTQKPASLDALKAIVLDGRTIDAQVTEQIGVIGEKLELAYFASVEAASVITYIHPGNRLATIVGFNVAGIDASVARDVAMQAAAMSPVSVSRDNVPADIIEKELEIGREKAREEGKPENMLDKIAQGRLIKFFKESTLLEQDFIKDAKLSVDQYLKAVDKSLTVTDFKRYTLGE